MGAPNCSSARSTISIARSTPAQNPRGLASRTSTVRFSQKKSGRPPRVGLVEGFRQPAYFLGGGAAEAIDDRLRPFEVFAPALQVPARRRPVRHVAQVADLVGELHQ